VTFTLLPAVDVANGQAVRLVRAEAGTETTYGAPRDAALAWQRDGAEWIHLVDLDAAFGRGSNADLLAAVVGELDVRVQLSGGIADDASLDRALATACARVNLSTAALADLDWVSRVIAAHGERVAVGLDVRIVDGDHRLAARGGSSDDGDLWATLARLERGGATRYVVTDVSKDGTLRGPNVELLREVTKSTAAPVVASGGIAQIADLVALAQAAADGSNVEGAIVGKALYAGRFTLPEALAAVRAVATTSRTAG
jgi:phosphoribosylanthranilate isomerase